MAEDIRIFISYSHRDKKYLHDLLVHLKPLVRSGFISVWSDGDLKSGEQWREKISTEISMANCAILLVSPDFLASDFIMSDEIPSILRSQEHKNFWVLQLFVRHVFFGQTNLSSFQGANDPEAPLASLSKSKQDKVLSEITKEIYNRFKSISANSRSEIGPSSRDNHKTHREVDFIDDFRNENFCEPVHFKKLQKIGNWLFDARLNEISGAEMFTYLLSSRVYKLRNLKITARICFKNLEYYRIDGVPEFNAGIIFGWSQVSDFPQYYNFVFSGQDVWFERIGFKKGDSIRDFEHLSVNKQFEVTEGDTIFLEMVFTDAHCGVKINGRSILSQVIPKDFSGKVGLRPWRSQIRILQFDIETI